MSVFRRTPAAQSPGFFQEIASQDNLYLRWHTGPLASVADDMSRGLYDVSAHGISNVNAAAPHNTLPSEPYLHVQRGFTVLQNSAFATLPHLPGGSRVAVMENSTALQDIQKNYPEDTFDLKMITQLEGSPRKMLRAGDIDAIAEGYTGFWFNPADAKDLTMIDAHPLIADQPDAEALVFWVRNGLPALREKINERLKRVGGNIFKYYQENGTCDTHYVFPE